MDLNPPNLWTSTSNLIHPPNDHIPNHYDIIKVSTNYQSYIYILCITIVTIIDSLKNLWIMNNMNIHRYTIFKYIHYKRCSYWMAVGSSTAMHCHATGGAHHSRAQRYHVAGGLSRHHLRSCKNPEPFQIVFSRRYRFFFLLSFFQALASHLDQRIHMSEGKGKGKGIVKEGKGKNRKGRGKGKETERKRNGKENEKGKEKSKGKRTGKKKGERKGRVKEETGKGKEREMKREKKAVSHTDHFWCQKLSFSLSFCYRSWILSLSNPVCVPFFLEMAAIIKKGV